MYKNKEGWYKVLNPNKVIKPIDNHMKSFQVLENTVQLNYKSSLELKMMKYCDFNKHIVKYSLEPFNIKYIKPTTGKEHRYFIDFFLEFSSGDKFIVEVKSKGETKPPKKPSKKTENALMNYQKAIQTYAINRAKWKAAKEFAALNNMKFIILTEEQLK